MICGLESNTQNNGLPVTILDYNEKGRYVATLDDEQGKQVLLWPKNVRSKEDGSRGMAEEEAELDDWGILAKNILKVHSDCNKEVDQSYKEPIIGQRLQWKLPLFILCVLLVLACSSAPFIICPSAMKITRAQKSESNCFEFEGTCTALQLRFAPLHSSCPNGTVVCFIPRYLSYLRYSVPRIRPRAWNRSSRRELPDHGGHSFIRR